MFFSKNVFIKLLVLPIVFFCTTITVDFAQADDSSFEQVAGQGANGVDMKWQKGFSDRRIDNIQNIQVINNGKPARTSCQTVCKTSCYHPESVSNATGAGCQCGDNFCKSCKKGKGWRPNPNSKGASDRCLQGDAPPQQQAASSNNNCNGPDVTYDPNDEGGRCICNATREDAGSDGKCVAKKAETESSKSLAEKCTNEARGRWSLFGAESEEDGTCSCADGSIVDVINGNNKCKSVAEDLAWCAGAKGVVGDGETWAVDACVCHSQNRQPYAMTKGQVCDSAQSGATEDTSDYNTKVQKILDDCKFNEMQERLDKCTDKSDEALIKCEKKAFESGNNAKQLGSIMQMLSTVQQNKAVERADPDICGKAAYGATTAYWALDAFKTTCDEHVKICKESCSALKENESFSAIKNNCEQMYNTRILGIAQSTTGRAGFAESMNARRLELSKKTGEKVGFDTDGEAKAWIRNEVSEMEKKSKDNLIKCESDAVSGSKDLAEYLSELLTTSMAAAQCKNAASSSAARCTAMASQLTQEYCISRPTEVCCQPYTGISKPLECNGADYSHRSCVCARSPDSTGCKLTSTTPGINLNNPGGVSTLAAPGGIGAGSQYKPQGAITQGGIDLNDSSDLGKAQEKTTSGGAVNPFGVANSGGGGGGGGLPNSPGDGGLPAAAAGEGGGDKGIVGGAFSQLKTLADRMFGTGSGNSNGKGYGTTGKDGKKTGPVDPNKWKPGLRGVAGGGSPFGPRNKDIWKIMNAQYGIQNHTFIGIDGK